MLSTLVDALTRVPWWAILLVVVVINLAAAFCFIWWLLEEPAETGLRYWLWLIVWAGCAAVLRALTVAAVLLVHLIERGAWTAVESQSAPARRVP